MPTLESNALDITTGNEICSINSRAAFMPPDGAHLITATSATGAITLADGADGQIKTFINTSTAGTNNVVITPANLRGYTNITLNAPGETVTLLFKVSEWNIIGGHGYVAA